MTFEGQQTYENLEDGRGVDPEVMSAFAPAEAGMEPIPNTVQVETIEDLAKELGLSPDALEQYRINNPGE